MLDRRAFITGGAGFVGSPLAQRLLAAGWRVTVYDSFVHSGRRRFLSQNEKLDVVAGDVRDGGKLANALAGFHPDIVFHLAAIHFVPLCESEPANAISVNVVGTQVLLDALKDFPQACLILASSAAVYAPGAGPHREIEPPGPVDVNGLSKFFAEAIVQRAVVARQQRCLVARLFNIYGPGETNPHLIPVIMEQVKAGHFEILVGNTGTYRDYIYVEDVVDALIAVAGLPWGGFDVFNVGTGREYGVVDIVETVADLLGRPLRASSVASLRRTIDQLHLSADYSHLSAQTGWQPRHDLRAGLAELLRGEGLL